MKKYAVDSSTVEAKEGGELIDYDGFKYKKGSKVHVCVDENSMPLSIALGPGYEHDSKRFNELLEGLDRAPKELCGLSVRQ